jgi:hypothetical protein
MFRKVSGGEGGTASAEELAKAVSEFLAKS